MMNMDTQQATADLIAHRGLFLNRKSVVGAAVGIKTRKGLPTGGIAIVAFVSEKVNTFTNRLCLYIFLFSPTTLLASWREADS